LFIPTTRAEERREIYRLSRKAAQFIATGSDAPYFRGGG
jgi:hypothetical protein